MRLTTIVASLAMALASVQANYLLENPFKDTFKMTQSDTVVNCENRLDEILRIDYINLSPDPPKRAQSFDIDAKAYLEEEIVEGAYMNVLVKAGLIKIIQKRFDFCEEAAKVGKSCPLRAGEQTFQYTVDLPKETPIGKFTARVEAFTVDNKNITCLQAQIIFRP